MMTKQQAEKLMRKINAQIDSYVCSVHNLTETMLNLENVCEIFDDDSARAESDWRVASRNSFYSQHVQRTIEDLAEMREWYESRLDIEYRKMQKLREALKAGLIDDGFNRDKFGNCELSYNILIENAGLTDDEIVSYTNAIRAALSENGNLCDVEAQENLIEIDGNAGGNIKKFLMIVSILRRRGCGFEFDREVDENGDWLQQEVSGYEWAWLKSLRTDNPLPRPNQYGDKPE